jgi:riboflavin kinase/FMN adenylyltransferase
MNIGMRPTFSGDDTRLEVHIFDFDQLIYGKTIQVHFIARIRDEQKFESAEALIAQLQADKKAAMTALGEAD